MPSPSFPRPLLVTRCWGIALGRRDLSEILRGLKLKSHNIGQGWGSSQDCSHTCRHTVVIGVDDDEELS